ncbi:MAG: DEAD/DEAH box helicase [Myxococcales bacterium]|nr:DEAD/DEAH box helicase [Myxococcales bacterium]
MEIFLLPRGILSCRLDANELEHTELLAIQDAFSKDWRQGLLELVRQKALLFVSPTTRFWGQFTESYLLSLCHHVEGEAEWKAEPPTLFELKRLYESAPPMRGGEYLSPSVLFALWRALDAWVVYEASKLGGLAGFLSTWAPQWKQVGRICFHLAENKKNPEKPFAFLATYSAGVGGSGQARHVPMGQALKEFAGQKETARLKRLIHPVLQAAEKCGWVEALLSSGELYRPLAWTPEEAYQFLLSIPELEESGLVVRVPDWWKKRSRPRVSVTIGENKRVKLGAEALLDFDVSLALGDALLSDAERRELLQKEEGLVFFKGQWIEVEREKLEEAIQHWEAIQRHAEKGEISFIEGMRLLAGATQDLKGVEEEDEERSWAHVRAGTAMRELLEKLRTPEQLHQLRRIRGLQASLRPYQERGVAWLALLSGLGLGACLADDMGLGKTIQVLALLLHRKSEKKQLPPSLLVVPTSLLGNWAQESARFAPSLRLLLLHPAEVSRATLEEMAEDPNTAFSGVDLVVTTYTMLTRLAWLEKQRWFLAILDEAQAIKNPSTLQSKATKKLRAHARIILTGTPVENRLGDLWSLFDFLNPGLLGSHQVFKGFVKRLEEREREQYAPLRRLISPYILRRMKTDPSIVPDLPDKVEVTRSCYLTKAQAKLYKSVVEAMAEALDAPTPPDGIQRKGLILQSLLRLKQICNHPSQVTGDGDFSPKKSGKFEQLAEICEELASRQEKVLIFTQFREMTDALSSHLTEIFGRSGLVLHGGTSVKQRKQMVEHFQEEDGPPFFILSLKAGGTGLNLTAASHVIHFDRWWNPAVEQQATDRAFRIGQHRNVLVHKFVTVGTIEESIDALLQEKQQLANEIFSDGQEVRLTELDNDALLRLVRLDVTRAIF